MRFFKKLIINDIAENILLSFVSLFLFLLSSGNVYGQFYSLGSDPGSAKWQQIETADFRIIYPREIDSLAQKYAKLMESANPWVQRPLKVKAKPIDVVLHPYSAISNGVVTWAPKRVEFMTRPLATGGYSQSWEKQLVVHEIRHIAQISKFEQGAFKPLSWIIGQQAQGLGVGLYIDKWALEGDAVVSETELSSSGRGRDPEHLIYFKASFLDGEFRSWREWKLGSGRKYSPDIYSLGYLVNSYIRLSSGNYYYMGDLMEYLVRHFYNPSGARKAYRHSTGKSIPSHFDGIKKMFGTQWAIQDSLKRPFTHYTNISKIGKDYATYKSVVAVSADSIYAIKWDMDDPSKLVLLDSGGIEKRISYVGNMSSSLSLSKGKLYWTEYIYSTRWEQESYSVLRCYDVKKDRFSTLTHRTSYYNPSASPSGDTIAVAEYSTEGRTRLVFLDSENHMPVASFAAPEDGQIKESVFLGDKVYATVITDKGMGLFSLDLKSRQWTKEISEHGCTMNRLNGNGDEIYFESDLNGTNNIYCYTPKINFLQRLTNARFGAFLPYLERRKGTICYSDYDKSGYRVVRASLDSLLWKPETFSKPYKDMVADMLSRQSGYSIDTVDVSNKADYPSRPYRKGEHYLRIHSWAPFYYNVDKIKSKSYESLYDVVTPGVTIYSQNTLSTATAMFAYSYKDGFQSGHMKINYCGIYPVIEISADYNERDRREIRLIRDNFFRKFQLITPVPNSPYLETSLFVYVPLNLSSGGWNRGLIPKFLCKFSNDSFYSIFTGRYRDYQYVAVGLQYYDMLNISKRDLFPKWGFGVNLQLNSVPFSEENFGSLVYSSIYGYLPGILANHGVKLSFTYQKQYLNGKNYLLNNLATSPRGYEQLYGKRFVSLGADYALPIYLGDTKVTSLLYLKRLQLIPFVDWAFNWGMTVNTSMLSAGADALVDFNILNISLPLSAGVRYARTMEHRNFIQFLFKFPM